MCGHYQCGGVKAAMSDHSYGLVDYWLAGHSRHPAAAPVGAGGISPTRQRRFNRVVELNVLRQVYNLSRTPVVQSAWKRGPRPMLHGMVYDIHDGLLRELALEVSSTDAARAHLEVAASAETATQLIQINHRVNGGHRASLVGGTGRVAGRRQP